MRELKSIWGVYHAKGGFLGEVSYVVGKLLHLTHCALCDITHKGISEKKTMQGCRSSFDVPFDLVHLNEQSKRLAAATKGKTPCVVAESTEGFEIMLGAAQLEDCRKNVESFHDALDAALISSGYQSVVSDRSR